MELSHQQKLAMLEDGYVLLPGVVPRIMVDRALREINASLGEGMPPDQMTRFRAQSYCPEVQRSAAISGLYNDTPARSLAESAIGAGRVAPVGGGQIALRFPTLRDPAGKAGPHLDGMYTPTNGVKEGTIGNFTALVGVFLSDVPGPNAGNFTVWPGTHRIFEQYFREHGPESLLKGMPPVPMPDPVQVTGRAGDVALVHYNLAHGVTPNSSPHVRYAIFFRLNHVEHAQNHWTCMTDIWLEWEGMRDLVDAARP